MRTQLAVLISSLVLTTGCAAPMTANLPVAAPIESPIVQGSEYVIEVHSSDESRVSYFGTAVENSAANESITLDNAIKRVEVTSSPRIPVIGQLFLNKSVGGSRVDGPITINRKDIVEIRLPASSQVD